MKEKDFTIRSPGRIVKIGPDLVAYCPQPLPPEWSPPPHLAELTERASIALGELRGLLQSLPNPDILRHAFVRREAVLSSEIEGTHTQLPELLIYEASDADESASVDTEDAREVHNFVVAFDYAVGELDRLPICSRLLRETHGRLMAGIGGDGVCAGELRRVQNFIGASRSIHEARFVPPPPDRIDELIKDLEDFINGPSHHGRLVQAALIHYQFEAIHPFADGNGRLGRLLVALFLQATGLLPKPVLQLSDYFVHRRREYYDKLLAVSLSGAWDEWVSFFLCGIEHEAKDTCRRSRLLLELREKYRDEFQRKNAAATLTILDGLFSLPVLTVNKAAAALGVTYRAAQKQVERLVEHGILREATGRERYRVYLADEILAILQERESQ
jgi:Fic family protein